MKLNTLKCTVAVIALSAGTAFAASDTEASKTTEPSSVIENTGEVIKKGANSAAEATENAVESTAEAAGNAAEAVEETVGSAATATADGLESAADATGDAIGDAATATEELAKDATQAVGNTVDTASDALTSDANAPVVSVMVDKAEFDGLTVGDIVGQNVYASTGEDVGEIDYVITDAGGLSAIVGVGGFLGLGEHDVSIPLEDFTIAEGDLDGMVLTDWTEEMLRALPEVDASEVETLEDDVRLTVSN